jgi:hypothetical protein
MVFFDWQKIYRKTGGSSKRILLVLQSLVMQGIPKSVRDPVYNYYYTDFSGKSFLIDPYTLWFNRNGYTAREVAEYMGLASYRSYAYYLTTKDTTLELLHSPLSENTIKSNRLLRIENERVHFLFEKSSRRKI